VRRQFARLTSPVHLRDYEEHALVSVFV